MFFYDRKLKILKPQHVDHTFIEKVLLVIKERVDNSQKEHSETAGEEKYFKILEDFKSRLENQIYEVKENVKMLTLQFGKSK